jgi:small subunit ribosomal protein S6
MANYEVMFIVNPNATDEEIDKINSQIEGVITAGGGKANQIEKLGKKRLAYLVDKFREGHYVLCTIEAGGAVIREIERRLRVMDLVIKYLTVRMDDDMKRLDKIHAHRQKRAARRGRARAEGGERSAPNPIDQMPEE